MMVGLLKKFIKQITISSIVCFAFSIFGADLARQLPVNQEEQKVNPQVSATGTGQPFDDSIKVVLNGRLLSFDVPPLIENGRTLVPLRVIFEALGATVQWDGATQTVTATKDDTKINLVIGGMAYKNDQPVTLDVPAMIVNDRTLVPIRFVSESLGAVVAWDDATSTVVITESNTAPSSPVPSDGANGGVALIYNGKVAAEGGAEALAEVAQSLGMKVIYFDTPSQLPSILNGATVCIR